MGRSPGFGSNTYDFIRPFQTRFRYGSAPEVLNLATYIHSPDHSTKGTRSSVDGLSVLVNTRFQVLFHSPPGVLFTFPSQYFFTIGHRVVFRLGGWSPHFRLQDSHLLRLTFPCHSAKIFHTVCCPNPECITTLGLASSAFARHYWRNLSWFLFLALLRCFSSGGSPHIAVSHVLHRLSVPRHSPCALCSLTINYLRYLWFFFLKKLSNFRYRK